jgi:hypothetical protein
MGQYDVGSDTSNSAQEGVQHPKPHTEGNRTPPEGSSTLERADDDTAGHIAFSDPPVADSLGKPLGISRSRSHSQQAPIPVTPLRRESNTPSPPLRGTERHWTVALYLNAQTVIQFAGDGLSSEGDVEAVERIAG